MNRLCMKGIIDEDHFLKHSKHCAGRKGSNIWILKPGKNANRAELRAYG